MESRWIEGEQTQGQTWGKLWWGSLRTGQVLGHRKAIIDHCDVGLVMAQVDVTVERAEAMVQNAHIITEVDCSGQSQIYVKCLLFPSLIPTKLFF